MNRSAGETYRSVDASAAAPPPLPMQPASPTAARAWITVAAGRLGVTEGTIRRWIRTGRLNPSCGQMYAQVSPYLDCEMDTQERTTVDRHLTACPGCEQHFAFDGAVLSFVRQRAPRPLMPDYLHARLLAPLRGQAPPER